ncbi:MAG: NAD(P)H-dependent glycerol-3-phosphate dehydrogenase [Burkholderiaceae bacterium]
MRIAFLGAGAWGTALAQHVASSSSLSSSPQPTSARSSSPARPARGPAIDVRLWARDPALLAAIDADRVNTRYLPDVPLDPAIRTEAGLASLAAWTRGHAESLCVIATSLAGLRPTLRAWLDAQPAGADAPPLAPLIWLCKGIEADTGLLPHQVVDDVLAQAGRDVGSSVPRGPLFGPSFAQEVARGLPAALTVAARRPGLDRRVQHAFHHGALRIYATDDVLGVELGGALKNVMAIATGICDGLQLGHNARAALITRGLAEISRLGAALGARAETFMGLTGLGDLVLTCTGDLSRNRRVGLLLAAGQSLEQVLAGLGHVAEGVACVRAAQRLGRAHGVDTPIVDAVAAVLAGRISPSDVVRRLLSRQPRRESE